MYMCAHTPVHTQACAHPCACVNPGGLKLLLNSVIWLLIYKVTGHDFLKIWKTHFIAKPEKIL